MKMEMVSPRCGVPMLAAYNHCHLATVYAGWDVKAGHAYLSDSGFSDNPACNGFCHLCDAPMDYTKIGHVEGHL